MLVAQVKIEEVEMKVAPFNGADLSNAPGMDGTVANDQKAVDEPFE